MLELSERFCLFFLPVALQSVLKEAAGQGKLRHGAIERSGAAERSRLFGREPCQRVVRQAIEEASVFLRLADDTLLFEILQIALHRPAAEILQAFRNRLSRHQLVLEDRRHIERLFRRAENLQQADEAESGRILQRLDAVGVGEKIIGDAVGIAFEAIDLAPPLARGLEASLGQKEAQTRHVLLIGARTLPQTLDEKRLVIAAVGDVAQERPHGVVVADEAVGGGAFLAVFHLALYTHGRPPIKAFRAGEMLFQRAASNRLLRRACCPRVHGCSGCAPP